MIEEIDSPIENGEIKVVVKGIKAISEEPALLVSPCDESLVIKQNNGGSESYYLWYDGKGVLGRRIFGQGNEIELRIKMTPMVMPCHLMQCFLSAIGSARRPFWLEIKKGCLVSLRFA